MFTKKDTKYSDTLTINAASFRFTEAEGLRIEGLDIFGPTSAVIVILRMLMQSNDDLPEAEPLPPSAAVLPPPYDGPQVVKT